MRVIGFSDRWVADSLLHGHAKRVGVVTRLGETLGRPLPAGAPGRRNGQDLHTDGLWPIVGERHRPGAPKERMMSHQPPKESKKKPQHTPKEKKTLKQQKKHAGDAVPFIKP